jgi:hypothetical protein
VAQNVAGTIVVCLIAKAELEGGESIITYFHTADISDPLGSTWGTTALDLPGQPWYDSVGGSDRPPRPQGMSLAQDSQGNLNLLLLTILPSNNFGFYITSYSGSFKADSWPHFQPVPSVPRGLLGPPPPSRYPVPYPNGMPTIGFMANNVAAAGFFLVDANQSLYLLKPTWTTTFPPGVKYEYEPQLAPSSCGFFNQIGPLAVILTPISEDHGYQGVFFTDPQGTTLLALAYSLEFAPAPAFGVNSAPVWAVSDAITVDQAQHGEFTPIGQLAVATNEASGIAVFGLTVNSNQVYYWRQIPPPQTGTGGIVFERPPKWPPPGWKGWKLWNLRTAL